MKHDIDEIIYVGRLLDYYGDLLTESQLEIMIDYYRANLSISEISELRNISRAAVSESISKGKKKLEFCEEKIGICKVFDSISNDANTQEIELLKRIEEKLKNGI